MERLISIGMALIRWVTAKTTQRSCEHLLEETAQEGFNVNVRGGSRGKKHSGFEHVTTMRKGGTSDLASRSVTVLGIQILRESTYSSKRRLYCGWQKMGTLLHLMYQKFKKGQKGQRRLKEKRRA